jgi:excinuclease ABC subunit B
MDLAEGMTDHLLGLPAEHPLGSVAPAGDHRIGINDPRERAAAGLNPVAGLDDVGPARKPNAGAATSGVTATVEALSALIDSGNPLFKDGQMWVPHRPERPEKSEGGIEIA